MMNIKYGMEMLLSILFPMTCPFCDKICMDGICDACREKLVYIEEPRCMRCGKPIQSEIKEYCADCSRKHHIFTRGYSLWIHRGNVKRAIYQFKYYNKRIYSRIFAREMAKQYGKRLKALDIALIIPIPISKKRRRKRGYNQAELLAVHLGKELGIPVESRLFIRKRDTAPQKTLDTKGRKDNLRQAFQWTGRRKICGNILIVDDIYTTGNTIDSAAYVLKNAGASEVYFLTISIGQGY